MKIEVRERVEHCNRINAPCQFIIQGCASVPDEWIDNCPINSGDGECDQGTGGSEAVIRLSPRGLHQIC